MTHSQLASLIFGAISSIAALSWGSVKINQNIKYEHKMASYSKLRDEFFGKNLEHSQFMCKDKICKDHEQYLPKPQENHLWKIAFQDLQDNNYRNYRTKLDLIKSYEELKDYCYGEVQKAIEENNKTGGDKEYFNVGGNANDGRSHERCVVGTGKIAII